MLPSKTGSETTGVCPESLKHGKVTEVKLVGKILETKEGKEGEGEERGNGRKKVEENSN